MANIGQIELRVRDNAIHCADCESRIEKVLRQVPGVLRVKADHNAQTVAITMDTDRTETSALKRKLEMAGYPSE